MKFTPDSDLIPEGEHDAVVMSAVDKKSAKGNEMIEMQVAVYVGETEYGVTDWLVDVPSMQYKIRHFCESTGIDYKLGDLDAAAVEGRNVRVSIHATEDEKFGKQSRIKDYLPRPTKVTAKTVTVPDDDESIPF